MRKIARVFNLAVVIFASVFVTYVVSEIVDRYVITKRILLEANFCLTIDGQVYPLYKLNPDYYFLIIPNEHEEEGYFLSIEEEILSYSPPPQSTKTKSGKIKISKCFENPKDIYDLETDFNKKNEAVVIKATGVKEPQLFESLPTLVGKTLTISNKSE